ncbi:cation-transporting ATPase [Elysia marginata]|uniref:Cation-transporting ATPase n=1 Tax=Elysia marginata TaxID=1093978 RepID=A0AAV4GIA6_9GAST|nr:cation-transporting ATPase [Elysia marginata]
MPVKSGLPWSGFTHNHALNRLSLFYKKDRISSPCEAIELHSLLTADQRQHPGPESNRRQLRAAITRVPNMVAGKTYVNPGEEEQMEIIGYRLSHWRKYLTWLGYLLTCGGLRLFFYWLPHLQVWAQCYSCGLARAEKVVLQDQQNTYHVAKVHTITRDGTGVKLKRPKNFFTNKHARHDVIDNPESDENLIQFFIVKKLKYIWDPETNGYIPLRGLDKGHKLSYFHTAIGLSEKDQRKRRVLYGANCIEVHVTSIATLLYKQVLSPFTIFQIFSMCVWYLDDYYIYATCIVIVTTLSIILTIYQTRLFERTLRQKISKNTVVSVCRGGTEYEEVSSDDLVPGDVIEIPRQGCDMLCDAVLITGTCIVNESMLTGESVPVTKTTLPNPVAASTGHSDSEPDLDLKHHSRHVLFCGTHVIQTRFYGNQKVKAVVLRTGYSTSKGELVRSILFPKPADFKFDRHSYYFVAFLLFVAIFGFVYTVVLMVRDEEKPEDIILRSLDLITIAVPPALPAALAVCVVFSQRRLKAEGVFCISPRGINVCGTIDAVCFDKTGTLTEDGLNMHGVVSVQKSRFEPLLKEASRLSPGPLMTSMAACHSLTIIEEKLVGDPLDLIMFEATDWELLEPGPDENRFDMMMPTVVRPKSNTLYKNALDGGDVGIVRQFPFSSSLQRMSVITRRLGADNFDLFVKGSPEMIASLSKKESIPFDFHQELQKFTQRGFRVIALAWKPLPSKLNYVKMQRINRDQVERDLTFLGLLVMENRLKWQSAPVIRQLLEADIRTVMVTGDNMLTALSVARECCMVDRTDRIILVQAYPPQAGQSQVAMEFVYADDANTKVEEVFSMENRTIQIDEDNQRFHFALTGKTWAIIRQHCPELLSKLVVRGAIFARMGPEQKAQLVEVLQDVGYYVGMCGDGANDCGALKTAHMGISLSEAEASVASPFTSKTPNIECVPRVVKEGRAALTTTFGVFKYIACYSLTQFVSVLILYWVGCNLTDPEFLYIDFFLITSFSITYWLVLNLVIAIGATLWINIYPTDGFADLIEIKQFPSMGYKLLFIGVACINFLLSFILEKFVIDNEVLRDKMRSCLKDCLPLQDQAYAKIESEIEQDPTWPPVSNKKVDLAEIFQKQESVVPVEVDMERSKVTLEDLLEHSDHEDGVALLSGKGDDSEQSDSCLVSSQAVSDLPPTYAALSADAASPSLLSSQQPATFSSTASSSSSSSSASSSTQQNSSSKTDETAETISSPQETVTTSL